MLRLEEFSTIRRQLRRDSVETLGVPTEALTLEAIEARDLSKAKALVEYGLAERKPVHDLSTDWMWGMMTSIARRWGEAALGAVLRETQDVAMLRRGWKSFLKMSVLERVQLCAEMMRSHLHRIEQNAQTLRVVESDLFFTIVMDPCGSGGRMRRGAPDENAASRLDVRRQGFWDNRRRELTEALVHQVCHIRPLHLDEASGAV